MKTKGLIGLYAGGVLLFAVGSSSFASPMIGIACALIGGIIAHVVFWWEA